MNEGPALRCTNDSKAGTAADPTLPRSTAPRRRRMRATAPSAPTPPRCGQVALSRPIASADRAVWLCQGLSLRPLRLRVRRSQRCPRIATRHMSARLPSLKKKRAYALSPALALNPEPSGLYPNCQPTLVCAIFAVFNKRGRVVGKSARRNLEQRTREARDAFENCIEKSSAPVTPPPQSSTAAVIGCGAAGARRLFLLAIPEE